MLHHSLNQFPTDGHLGCSPSPAVTNRAAMCNLALMSFPVCVSVFAGESPRSNSVVIATDTATRPPWTYIWVVLPD